MKGLFNIILGILFLCSCNGKNNEKSSSPPITDIQTENSGSTEYRKISDEQAHEMMASEENFILLDVRTDEEYSEMRIEGATLIPDYEITSRAESELSDKEALIFVYCRSGRRSEVAAKELIRLGYTNVYDFGGIIDWSYETVGG